MKKLLILALLLTLLVAPTFSIAQDDDLDDSLIGSAGIGDPLYPLMGNGGYDVTHYTIDLTVDLEARMIDGTTLIDAVTTQDLGRFNFDLTGLAVSAVSVNDIPATYEQADGELIITPESILPAQTAFTVSVSYAGSPDAPNLGGWRFYDGGALIGGEPNGGNTWFPVNEHPLDKATYTFRITVAEPNLVGANGTLMEVIDNGDTSTYVWEMDDPMASYLATLAIGDFNIVTDQSASGIPIRNYFSTAFTSFDLAPFEHQAEMIDYLETVFGPYPFDVYGSVVHDYPLNFALETQTLTTFGSNLPGEGTIVHELAHAWFGDSLSVAQWSDIWLNEGFATYAQILWTEYSRGPVTASQMVEGFYGAMISLNFGFTPDSLSNRLDELELTGITLTQEQATQAFTLLFGGSFGDGMLARQTEDIGEAGISDAELIQRIEDFRFTSTNIPLEYWYQFFVLIGQQDYADENDFRRDFVISNPNPNHLFASPIYVRGALTLAALRATIGDDAFFETLRTYTQRYYHGNVSTADFIAVAEEISGQQLDDLFDAWLNQVQLPDIPELDLYASDFQ